jgi:hypothetical protein
MNRIILLIAFVPFLFGCNMAREKDYENLAEDVCGCVNNVNLSKEFVDLVVKSNGNEEEFKKLMSDYSEADPARMLNDFAEVSKITKDMETCMTSLEKKYDHLYTNDSKDEVQKKFLEAMSKNSGCKFTYAFFMMGLNSQK